MDHQRSPRPDTVEDLEQMVGVACDCGCEDETKYIRSGCCDAYPSVSYTKGTGRVTLQCSECEKFICTIAVARRSPAP
jgi:hypothetical protein